MRAGRCFGQTVSALVVFNLARSYGLLGPEPLPAAVLTVAMALIAWGAGATAGDLGLRGQDVPAGLRYGGAAFGLVLAAIVIVAVIPATNGFLHDTRAAISGGRIFYELVVPILIGTVLPEELAFRGVLLGSALQLWGTWRAVVITSFLFGLWHITTTLHTQSDNQMVRHASAAVVVIGAVAATSAAGVVFCWLRVRSMSLVAPALAHLATNGLALTVAWLATH